MVRIGILAFPKVQQLDLTAPYEVFATWPEAQVSLVWKDREAVISSTGLRLQPDVAFADCAKLDVICVPGGAGINPLLLDDETLDFVRARAAEATFVTSVCTGALVLGAAGLLRGKRATTHWTVMDLLPAFDAIPTQARVVRDGSLITGGGVTAGIDFALTLIGEIAGREMAEAIQLQLEYQPAPPYAAGNPDTAPTAAVVACRTRGAALRAERERLVALAAKRLG